MMDIDEELSLQIKTVFDNFDDGRSEMGWAMLLEKYQEKPSKRFPIWLTTGIAAMLAIVAGVWLFLSNPAQKTIENDQIVQKTDAPSIKNNQNLKQPDTQLKSADPNLSNQLTQPQIANNETGKSHPIKETKANSSTSKTILKPVEPNLPQQIKEPQVVKNETNRPNPINEPKINLTNPKITSNEVAIVNNQNQQVAQISVATNKIDSTKQAIDPQLIANQTIKVPQDPISNKKTTEEFLIEQSKIAANKVEQKVKEKKERGNRNSYEVFTGTFLNYYGDNEVKVNAGFGLNANLKVSKGLFLSVGAGVSQNKISYQSYSPNTSRDKGVLYADAPASYSSATSGGATNTLQAGFVSNTKLSAQLLSLDIPILLKFYPTKKQNFYLSTGFNSNSYFAQKYDYTYTVTSASAFASKANSEFEETQKTKFKGFELANSAIFAIGINQKIGKTNNLIFEPYFKPAIGNMGDKNLRINTAGLNLKFSFGNTIKK